MAPPNKPKDSVELHFDPQQGLVHLRLVGNVSENEWRELYEQMDKLLMDNEGSRMVLYDALESNAQAAAQHRHLLTAWIDKRREILKRRTLGQAFLLKNPLDRVILSAVLLVAPLPYPYGVFETREEAMAWLNELKAAKKP